MNNSVIELEALSKAIPGGWIEYDPVIKLHCYRTWSRQVTANNWAFTLYNNWHLVNKQVGFNQAIAFLEFGNGDSLDSRKD